MVGMRISQHVVTEGEGEGVDDIMVVLVVSEIGATFRHLLAIQTEVEVVDISIRAFRMHHLLLRQRLIQKLRQTKQIQAISQVSQKAKILVMVQVETVLSSSQSVD